MRHTVEALESFVVQSHLLPLARDSLVVVAVRASVRR